VSGEDIEALGRAGRYRDSDLAFDINQAFRHNGDRRYHWQRQSFHSEDN
jgi:hypothetical protein